MKKILAFALMMAVLVVAACPAFASGEQAAPAAAEAPHYSLQVIQEPTCTENGVSAYVDDSTGAVLFTFDVAATGHVPSADEPTCTDDVVCLVCGEVLEPAAGHEYEYQYDAERDAGGDFVTFGTWQCVKCGDVQPATEGNAVYYYGQIEEAAPAEPAEPAPAEPAPATEEPAASGEPSAEPAASGEPAAATEEPAEEAAEAPAVMNPDYDPDAHNWASIEIVMAIAIVVVFVILMLSFGKKKS